MDLWTLHINGSSNARVASVGLILTNLDDVVAKQALRFSFKTSNNEVEYKIPLANLRLAKELKVRHLNVFSDSQLVVGQVQRECKAKAPKWKNIYIRYVRSFLLFNKFKILHISKSKNV